MISFGMGSSRYATYARKFSANQRKPLFKPYWVSGGVVKFGFGCFPSFRNEFLRCNENALVMPSP